MTGRIVTATIADAATCASVLADAFRDDPLMATIWPDRARRHAALTGYFTASLRHFHIAGGGVRFVEEDGAAVAVEVWDPPGRQHSSLLRTARALPALLPALRTRVGAAVGVRSTLDAHHPSEPAWYLANLGSTQSARGRGFVSTLLLDRLARCDSDGDDAYLVCTSADNVTFYEKFGFEVTETFPLASGAVMTSMWRRPAGS
ncbi:MAG: N-acetyltransferase [Rhodococcus fascians]